MHFRVFVCFSQKKVERILRNIKLHQLLFDHKSKDFNCQISKLQFTLEFYCSQNLPVTQSQISIKHTLHRTCVINPSQSSLSQRKKHPEHFNSGWNKLTHIISLYTENENSINGFGCLLINDEQKEMEKILIFLLYYALLP